MEPFGSIPGTGSSMGKAAALLSVVLRSLASADTFGSRSARFCVTRAWAASTRERALSTPTFCRAARRTASPSEKGNESNEQHELEADREQTWKWLAVHVRACRAASESSGRIA